ncbi:MAG: hypothetical protein ABH950_07765 [Candidatus Altiarchaeota archaeon]
MTKQGKLTLHIDISGILKDAYQQSTLGFKRTDGVTGNIYIRHQTKRAYYRKYRNKLTDCVGRLYAIAVYYAIKDYLTNVEKIRFCRDIKFRHVKNYLNQLFVNHKGFKEIKLELNNPSNGKSNGHYPALKAFRNRSKAKKFLTLKMIESKLF